MTQLDMAPDAVAIPESAGSAPYTRRLLTRTFTIYLLLVAAGSSAWILDGPDAWKTLGAGVAFPGAGFISSGSWAALLVIPVLVLTALAGVAWFGAGMVIALPIVWISSALVAMAVVDQPRQGGYLVVLAVVAAIAVGSAAGLARRAKAREVRRQQRNATVARTVGEVRAVRDRTVASLRGTTPELSETQAAALRYVVDLAHQEQTDWTGYDRIDIFQPSALRYQINQLGWALAVAQSAYAPAFGGYLSTGQRALIEKYLQPEVLGYWKYERLWGHLRWEADPVGRDNIMLTGYFGLNLALYAGNTGDDRYAAKDSMLFKVTKHQQYPHSSVDVRDSLLDNYAAYHDQLCLFPCEPNWAYSGCNFRGAATLAAFDRADGTTSWPDLREHFLEKLTSEFITKDGSVVALRSTLTGLPVPFPMPDSVLPKELSPTAPELAERYWALVRDETLTQVDGQWVASLPGVNLDFGTYTKSDMFALGGLYGSAREMGDFEVADDILATIDRLEPRADGPALWYPNRSNLFNATLAMDRLLGPGGWHDALNVPATAATLTGPVLDDVAYPDVLVLAATTDGTALAFTLKPGDRPGRHLVHFARLVAGQTYLLSTGESLVADAEGRASAELDLSGPTEFSLAPVR